MALRKKLRVGEFVFTAEVTPRISTDPGDLWNRAAPLLGLADAVNVTDGAAREPISMPLPPRTCCGDYTGHLKALAQP